MAHESDVPASGEGKGPAPELRLLDRRAFVGFPPLQVAPGVAISDFALLIPDVSFPFNVSAGASKYQRRRLNFGFLELTVEAEAVARAVAEVAGQLGELEDVKLHFRAGLLEAQARLRGTEKTPLTFKLAFDGDGENLAVFVYDVRLYGFAPTPSVTLPLLLTRALEGLELLPDVAVRGGSGFTTRVLPALCQRAAVSRGFKMPTLEEARLAAAEVTPRGLKLRFAAGGLPPPAPPDEELLLALEGARAFADAEELLAQGRLAEAREAYLRAGDVAEAHPFAAERLLSLLVADPQAHELALDIAATLARRRDKSPAALWGEAVVRERRGEAGRAAERFLALCAHARKAGEEAAAFFAAEAAARAARDAAPQVAVRALHEVLGLRPDHLPSLQALARAADQAKDRVGAVRAYRRIAALARDTGEAAQAHVHLARLCAEAEDDVAGARLHCEAALRLIPDQPDALLLLGELCHRSGEHLRALKALDRLREVAMARHELDRVGRADLLAGRVWELGLEQLENALLRYREAASLLPHEPEAHHATARVAEALGKVQEALAAYAQAVELAGPAPRDVQARRAAHASHHALARLSRGRLGDPQRARSHLEAALALEPQDVTALEELIPYFRATGRLPELADACEKAAQATDVPERRAAFWAEAGELHRNRLGNPDVAERLLTAAVEADGKNRTALEGLLALAEGRRDGALMCRTLRTLAELTPEPAERVRAWRRLAVAARDLAFDLELAVEALGRVLALEPDDLPSLGELCALQRRRGDVPGLAHALEARARAAEAAGDRRLAAAALRELAQLYESRLGRVGEALVALEKAARLAPDTGVLLDLADLSLRSDRPEHARRALEDVLATLPKSTSPERVADIRARLGRACEQLGDREAALEHYARALPLRRLDETLAERLEALYTQAGEERALADMRGQRAQALLAAGRPEAAAPLFLQSAQGLLRLGETGPALQRLHAALEAHPEGEQAARTLDAMAALELERGERLEAARLYARKAALVEEATEAARLLMRAATLAAGSPREEHLVEDALARVPAFPPARIRRAELRAGVDARGALEDVEVALAAPAGTPDAPSDAERLALLRRAAHLALEAGLPDTARRHLGAFAARRPADVEAQLELVELHRRAGAREALCELLGELWPKLPPERQRGARREFAELALSLGRPGEALEALRAILADAPADAPPDAWAASTLLGLLPAPGAGTVEQEDERLALLGRLVAAEADGEARAALLARRAGLWRGRGRLTQAREDLREAARLAAQAAPLLQELTEVLRLLGDAAAELDAWRTLVECEPAAGERAAPRLAALSRALLEAGDAPRARAGYEALAGLSLPEEARCEAFLGLADACRAAGDAEAAAAALREAAGQGPQGLRVSALLQRAHLLSSRGQLREAADSLTRALALAPGHPEATARLKEALRALGDVAPLAEVLEAEAAAAPPAQAAALWRELAALADGPLEAPARAEAALRRACALAPTDAGLRLNLAERLTARGEQAEARALLEEAAALLPPREAAPLLRRAAASAREAGQADAALALARRAHALVPAEGEELALLAELLFARGELAEALPLQRQRAEALSLTEAPLEATGALLRLGALCERAGDVVGAEAAYRRLLEARPAVAEAAERLAALLSERSPRQALEVLWAHARRLPASEATARLLVTLATRAREQLADVSLAAELLAHAAEVSPSPLPVVAARVDLFRQAGRTSELLAELLRLAALAQEAGEGGPAVAALEEAAALAERAGQVDAALEALASVRALHLDAGQAARAADAEGRRARLLRDAKLDLEAAARALAEAFALAPTLETAREAAALAHRQSDAAREAHWLAACVPLVEAGAPRAALQLQRAGLFAQALASPEQAEASARAALAEVPRLPGAEALLEGLLVRGERHAELAAYLEEAAGHTAEPSARAALLRRAADLYRGPAGQPEAAAAALLAARAATPEDLALTREVAELLHSAGRAADAADFDAVLLGADPLLPGVWERHRAFLEETDDVQGLAALMFSRARGQEGREAAESYLAAADAFRRAGAVEQALLCEDAAFARAPQHEESLRRQRTRAEGDARRLGQLLAQAAEALPEGEALPLLRERALRLAGAGEALLAAEAFDAYLARAADDVEALAQRAELAAASGGPRAAQPYDRRLLAAGGDALPLPTRVRTRLRLGHAALATGALEDAADAFEAVLALVPDTREGEEALSLLAEVHGRRGDARGVFRTTLLLAQRAQGEEAEALLRRAADVLTEPAGAVEALLPLARLRPTDATVLERAAEGLAALGRHAELVELYERGAEAAGGGRAAQLLLQAAQVAEGPLADGPRAHGLRERAAHLAPASVEVLRQLVAEHTRRGDHAGLLEVLPRLVELTEERDEAARLRLALAQAAREAGDGALARRALEEVVAQGPRGACYAEALGALEALLRLRRDDAALAALLQTRAQGAEGAERARLLLEASESLVRAGQLAEAIAAARASVALQPEADALLDLAALHALAGEQVEAARVRVQAADLVAPEERTRLLREAAEAFTARGAREEACAVLERLHAEAPEVLPALAFAARLTALGAHARALEVGFGPLMAEGRAVEALALADAAKDAGRAREVLWALARTRRTEVQHLQRLASLLRQEGDYAGLLRLAEQVDAQAPTVAAPLLDEVLFQAPGPEERERALRLHLAREHGDAFLLALLPRLGERGPRELVDVALEAVRGLPPERRELALLAAVAALPDRAAPLLRELYALQLERERLDDAERTLVVLLEHEREPKARASLSLERGRLLLALQAPEVAREAYERALADDAESVEAVRQLLPLLPLPEAAERLVALAERLEQLAGAGAVAPFAAQRAEAYAVLGRTREAYAQLGALEETPERLAERARLAEALGLKAEALGLRERLAHTPEARQAVLEGYLEQGLVPRAVALALQLLSAGTLGAAAERRVALALASAAEGADLAAQLWPDLLSAQPVDAEGWRAYAQALRQLGQEARAARMEGLAAALADAREPAPAVDVSPVERPVDAPAAFPAPPTEAVEVSAATMPRLHAALAPALASLGAAEVAVVLDVQGGVEAYLAGPSTLVVGAGALSCFGPTELVYLAALGLALGAQGAQLARPGAVPALPMAARRALRAVPSPLAAARVVAQLDASVRGGDPAAVKPARVLAQSEAFAALALESLVV